jgi:hypothetical protein
MEGTGQNNNRRKTSEGLQPTKTDGMKERKVMTTNNRYYYQWEEVVGKNLVSGWMVFKHGYTDECGGALPIALCTVKAFAVEIRDALNAQYERKIEEIKAASERERNAERNRAEFKIITPTDSPQNRTGSNWWD